MERASVLISIDELRRTFDHAYATPASPAATQKDESFLAIRVAGNPYLLRASELRGLAVAKRIVGVPSPISELMGVTGIRGSVVPVYSLAVLLGYGDDLQPPRWLAIWGSDEPAALAFSSFEKYLLVPRATVFATDRRDVKSEYVKEAVRESDLVRGVINMHSLAEIIYRRCQESRASKER